MKETIYTIPVNEAYSIDCECPLCELEKKLEKEAVQYSLGAAMMEPDYRILSNEKGYCNRHYNMMFSTENKLALALVLDTHLMEVRKTVEELKKTPELKSHSKIKLIKKGGIYDAIDKISDTLSKTECGCVTCDKINHTMDRYIDVLLYMWANDDEFKEKFTESKGVCLKHFKMLAEGAKSSLKGADVADFLNVLIDKEISELSRIQDDIHKFTLKFDYRNQDMPWGTAKDAPKRTIEKLSGYIGENGE